MATTYTREALTLYRDVLRACRLFRSVPHPSGVPQSTFLRQNARKEFEDARYETDPEVTLQLIIGGRNAVKEVQKKVIDKIQPNITEPQ